MTTISRFSLLLAACTACFAVDLSAQDSEPKVFSVRTAVSTVLESHPTVKSASESLNEARAKKRTAFASIFPSISAVARGMQRKDSFNSQSQLFGGETYNYYDVGLTAEQPIFSGGALWGGLGTTGAEVSVREKDFEIKRREMIRNTIFTFYELLISQKRVETIERTVKLQTDTLHRTENRARIGTSRQLDVYEIRATLANLKPRLLEAKTQQTLKAAEMAGLLGLRDQTKIKVTGQLVPPVLPRSTDTTPSPTHIEVERADLTVAQAEAAKQAGMSKHWPKLSLFGEWSRNATVRTQLSDADRTSYAVGIKLVIPLFSGLSSFSERAALSAAEARAEAEREAVRTRISIASVKADEDLKLGLALVEARDEALVANQAAYQEARNRYSTGTATYYQVADAQKNTLDAEIAADQSKSDYIVKVVDFFIAKGWSLDPVLEALEKSGKETK